MTPALYLAAVPALSNFYDAALALDRKPLQERPARLLL
jgi:hypothetical protein